MSSNMEEEFIIVVLHCIRTIALKETCLWLELGLGLVLVLGLGAILLGYNFPRTVLHNRKGNLGYGTCSKYLAYSIENQVVDFEVQASVWNPFLRYVTDLTILGKVSGGVHFKQIFRLMRTCQNCIL